ncbi:MAG: hypothetical protein QM520_02595 [Gammaproteobacteria bacterium]|nr:hypothetical protein [Gammaproteobacteria bacterium]
MKNIVGILIQFWQLYDILWAPTHPVWKHQPQVASAGLWLNRHDEPAWQSVIIALTQLLHIVI